MVPEIYVGGGSLEDCFYCYSQQIISAIPRESLIPYNLIQRAAQTQNLKCYNTECHPKPNQTNVNTAQFLEQKILFHTNINNKNLGKIVCKMQSLKKWLVVQCIRWLNKFN